ncbi:MAG: ATP-binding protein [Bacteroidaceae bacterium]|nr:ATP-binding protein [Bacteroidaceae bacterium]
MYDRIIKIDNEYNDSVFLWGARQVGKTTWLTIQYPNCRYYDLLRPSEFERLLRHPELLSEELENYGEGDTVIIDEIQKLPQLLDEVHYLIQRKGIRFILSGSSARKLKRVGTNLLGGRATKEQMFPLVSAEIPDFDLLRAINNGMIPRHYMVQNPWERLRGYIGVYLNEEIREEALTRNLKSFSHFLEIAARCNGEMLVYKNIAQDCGIDYRTVKEYFAILEDTLVGYLIPGFTRTSKRISIAAPKFYFFDVGIANYLSHRREILPGTDDFGHAFEHLIIQEIIAYLGYSHSEERLTYWRTKNGYEVDAIIGEGRVAIEVKSSEEVQSRHTRGLKAFSEDFPEARLIIVSLDKYPRKLNGVDVIPAVDFLKDLWNGMIL